MSPCSNRVLHLRVLLMRFYWSKWLYKSGIMHTHDPLVYTLCLWYHRCYSDARSNIFKAHIMWLSKSVLVKSHQLFKKRLLGFHIKEDSGNKHEMMERGFLRFTEKKVENQGRGRGGRDGISAWKPLVESKYQNNNLSLPQSLSRFTKTVFALFFLLSLHSKRRPPPPPSQSPNAHFSFLSLQNKTRSSPSSSH